MGFKDWFKKTFSFEEEQEELTPIATNTWIKVYYKILFKPNEKWTKKQIEKYLQKEQSSLIHIVMNLGQVSEKDGRIHGFINPALNQNAIFTYNIGKEFLLLHFNRNFTFWFDKSKEYKDCYEILIRAKERKPNDRVGVKILKKNEKRIYGYSPVDFMKDKFMLAELNKQLCEYLEIPQEEIENIAYPDFNKNNKPIIRVKIGVLFVEHLVKDRLELKNKNPQIEKACFGDFDDFIKHLRKQKNNKEIFRWLKKVDKLLKNKKEI